jgi:glycolate oxidase FAD binding subunit
VVTDPVAVDGVGPGRVASPSTPEELAGALRSAADAGEAVIPVGGGRVLGLGDVPERFDVALSTRGLSRIIEASQADLTLTVEAGATLEEVDEALRPLGQQLPLDPPAGPGHTVGGVLATGLSGPLRQRFGSPRDFLIGLRVALPDGRLAASGGRVVKNVSGYDMNKLHLGALGSLGVIVAASFKVFPRPHEEVTLSVSGPADPWAEAGRALDLAEPALAVELDSSGRVLARLGGSGTALARQASELGWQEADPGVWDEPRRRGDLSESWARISVPPRHLRSVLEGLPAGASWWGSPGVGVAHWTGSPAAEEVVAARAAAERCGGSLVLVAAPPDLKRQVGAWGSDPATLEWMRRLRSAFDPSRTLSPGRYVV